MLSKAKKIFSNPVYLLVMVISIAVLAVGSVLAFNALAADDSGTLDSNGYYKLYNIDYMYYNGTDTDVEVQRYYQEIIPINEKWKIASNEITTYFKKVSDDSAEAFTIDTDTMLNLKLTADVPDSSSPGWNDKVWIYKSVWDGGYHCICLGSTTVSEFFKNISSPCTVNENGSYKKFSEDLSALTLDTSQADINSNDVDFDDGSYCYKIVETKPYTYDGNPINWDRWTEPTAIGLTYAEYLKMIELFYAADPDIEYTADYQIAEDVPYGERVTLKKSTTDSFAFAQDVELPVCTKSNAPVVAAKAVIYDTSGDVIYTAEVENGATLEGALFYGDGDDSKIENSVIDNYAVFTPNNGSYISRGNWLYQYVTGASGTHAVNLPINVIVQYDYSRYKSADSSNINDPGNLDGKSTDVYKSNFDSMNYQYENLDYLTFALPDADSSPEFHPQGTASDVWCATEFWRDKGMPASKYDKVGNINVSDLAFPKGIYGDNLKALYTFNDQTGYWERTVLIEPIFEDCYLSLTYHDTYWDESGVYDEETNSYVGGYVDNCVSIEVHPYVYKDDSGNLLETPLAPLVKIKSSEEVIWYNEYGYSTDLMSYHVAEKFVNWNTQADGTGTEYNVGNTLTMTDNIDIYTQWEALVYHIQYEFNSPTGNNNDIYFDGIEYFPENGEVIPSFSSDYNYYYLNEYYASDGNYYYLALSVKPNEDNTSKVPDGTYFQYWSLTNNADGTNAARTDIYPNDFKEGDDGEYYITVYAVWEQPQYTLVYDENKQDASDTVTGMPDPSSVTVKYSDLQKGYALSDAKPAYSEKSFVFKGWGKTSTGSDTITTVNYSDFNDADGNSTLTDGSEIRVYAIWETPKTVTYDANVPADVQFKGTVPVDEKQYLPDEEVTVLGNTGSLTREGYTFKSWDTASAGSGTSYSAGDKFKISGDITLYAQWEENTYTLDYQAGEGHSSAVIPDDESGLKYTGIKNGKALSSQIPTDAGYTFAGWQVNDVDSKLNAGGTVPFASFNNANKTAAATATWTKNSHNVTYWEADGTTQIGTEQTYEYMSDVKVGENAGAPKTFDNKTWTGKWAVFDSPSTAGDNKTIGGTGTTFKMPDNDVKFKAVYEVTLTYDGNEATSGTVPASVTNDTEVTETVKNNVGGLKKTGYTFDGWKDAQGNAYTIGQEYTFDHDITLYAQWKKDSFEVKYYEADGNTPITTHTYEFRDAVNVGNGVTPTLIGEGEEWSGKWELINSAQKDADNADIGTRNNYPMPAETVEYKAVLDTKTYTVTYVVEGEQPGSLSFDLPAVITYDHGDTVNVASVPTGYDTSEYNFTGWNYNESGVYYAGGTSKASFKITEDVVLKGVWEKLTTDVPDNVTITYTSGITGDDVPHPSLNNTRTEQVTFGSDYTVHDNEGWTNYVRPGYKFVSWKVAAPQITGFSLVDNLVARFTGPATVGQNLAGGDIISPLNDSITLEAQWEEVKYTVTYNANGATSGTVPTDDKDYSYNEIASVKDKGDLAKAGAVFLNWNTQPNGNGITYAPNAQITMTEDVTLYAIWKAEPSEDTYYTLKYDANGATSGSVPQDHTHYLGGEDVTVADKGNLTKTDCTFKEWNTKSDGKGTGYSASDVFTMPESDVTLYAIWVNSEGDIVSPGTGETALGIQAALASLIISVMAGGCVVMAMLKKHRRENVK